MRVRRSVAAVAITLTSVSWGASASAAPAQGRQQERAPDHVPVVIVHTMSSCGGMDGF